MQNFMYYAPTRIYFGKGAQERAAEAVQKAGGSRVFLVYGSASAEKSGLLERVKAGLAAAGIACEAFGGARPNPRLDHAEEGVRRACAFGADFILALGGGSAIDTAKAIAHGTANPEIPLWDIWTKKTEISKSLPIGSILTISAAGSETSDSAVLTNTELGIKKGVTIEQNRPVFAVMDPELTYTVPKYQLSAGIVDILMHTLDRYFAPPADGNEMTDVISEGLMRTVIHNAQIAEADQTDYQAMSELMWAGSISHNGITELGRGHDFSVHKLGHSLSATFDMTHGASLALCWGNWAEEVWDACPERFAKYARVVWGIEEADTERAALAGIQATKEFFRSLHMPTCFSESETGILSEETIAELADLTTENGTASFGLAKKLGREEVLSIYRRANI